MTIDSKRPVCLKENDIDQKFRTNKNRPHLDHTRRILRGAFVFIRSERKVELKMWNDKSVS